jgi:general L-amino acid transport system substrate-binding protein
MRACIHINTLLAALVCLLALVPPKGMAADGQTISAIRDRGHVIVGVSTGLPGFSTQAPDGRWVGMDADLARAIAAATLNDPDKIRWVPLAASERFEALRSGRIDVLVRNTTITMSRELELGLVGTAISFFDGQAFMVPAKSKLQNARQLRGATVCVQAGTTSERNLTEYSRVNKLRVKPLVLPTLQTANAAYAAGRCNAYTADASALAAIRAGSVGAVPDNVILPELISKEPHGPMVRRDDDRWAAIVRWVLLGLVEAEEFGLSKANVDQLMRSSDNPDILRLLGRSEPKLGELLGLDPMWLTRAVTAVGNYGEIFARNVGPSTPLGLPRGKNALWIDGGLMYSPPLR